MKKMGIINSSISSILGKMRHTDLLVIGDAGLPIPKDVLEIDVAIKKNVPKFILVLETILADMYVEKAYIAKETIENNKEVYEKILKLVDKNIVVLINHEDLKKMSKDAKAIIRTGEMTPYANIILQSKVCF